MVKRITLAFVDLAADIAVQIAISALLVALLYVTAAAINAVTTTM